MKRKTYGLISAAFVLVLAGSVAYLIHRENVAIFRVGEEDLSQASAELTIAASMPIPTNTLSDRAITVSYAAALIQAADLCLRKSGVQHLYGLSKALSGFSFDLPYPNTFGRQKVQREWQFIVSVEQGLNSCWSIGNNTPILNLKRLHAVIADLYREMPVSAAQRQAFYNVSQYSSPQ